MLPGGIATLRDASNAAALPWRSYVTNSGGNSVGTYNEGAMCGPCGLNGNVKPLATIAGSNTAL